MGYDENDPEAISPILLGQLYDQQGGRHLIGFDDDRHVVTVAGSRAGKGESLIIPNLLTYKGSVICIDPKGENASVTAAFRARQLGQQVHVLDPFGVAHVPKELKATFNPLQWIDRDDPEAVDDLSALADAIIIPGNTKDPHWDESARTFIKGILLLMTALAPAPEARSFDDLRSWASLGLAFGQDPGPSVSSLLEVMKQSRAFGGAVAAVAATMQEMGDRERGSILSTARRNLEFLESPLIRGVLRGRSSFDPADFKRREGGITLYLVLPEWRLATHARWLRMMISTLLQALERTPKRIGGPKPAVLLILEEFATLGYLQSVERAAGYIAGFGVKLWSVLQDLNQLKAIYPERWETFLGNAGILTAFGNIDVTTIRYLSARLAETELVRTTTSENYQSGCSETGLSAMRRLERLIDAGNPSGAFGSENLSKSEGYSMSRGTGLHKTDLMTAGEIALHFAREQGTLLALIAGLPPVRLLRLVSSQDPFFKDRRNANPFHI